MDDIITRLKREAQREPNEPIWRDAIAEVEKLRIGHQRYETARRMSPLAWQSAWQLNTATGKPFDEIIDDLRPFVAPNEPAKGRAESASSD